MQRSIAVLSPLHFTNTNPFSPSEMDSHMAIPCDKD
jgi:hypothetical protein